VDLYKSARDHERYWVIPNLFRDLCKE